MHQLIPVAGSIATSLIARKTDKWQIQRLKTMFYGASIYGVVDHGLNGEFFMMSGDIVKDTWLGVVISLTVIGVWLGGIVYQRFVRKPALAAKKK